MNRNEDLSLEKKSASTRTSGDPSGLTGTNPSAADLHISSNIPVFLLSQYCCLTKVSAAMYASSPASRSERILFFVTRRHIPVLQNAYRFSPLEEVASHALFISPCSSSI